MGSHKLKIHHQNDMNRLDMGILPFKKKWTANAHLALRTRNWQESSENSATNAWNVNFNNGNLNNNNKTNENRVRPVSAFLLQVRRPSDGDVYQVMHN